MKIYWPFQLQSMAILALMFTGLFFRRQKKIHIRFMSSVIIWDLLLILQIELARSAVEKAAQVIKNPSILNIHVALAVSTVVLYFCLIYTGRKLLHGKKSMRNYHRFLGRTAVILRILTFGTSFFAA
jgi:uncharacterized membrane protein YozB (DUF420 family)